MNIMASWLYLGSPEADVLVLVSVPLLGRDIVVKATLIKENV